MPMHPRAAANCNPHAYVQELGLAREAAKTAGRRLVQSFGRVTVEIKQDGSHVTAADREAEKVIRSFIEKAFPGDPILGEELGGADIAEDRLWVIDPLDGTTWFGLGVPLFGVLIALVEEGAPVVGVIHFPMTSETVYAAKTGGCFYQRGEGRTEAVRVRHGRSLSEAFVSASGIHGSTTGPVGGPDFALDRVMRQAGHFRFAGDCLQHALVARGVIDAAIDTIMAPWDIAALVPCLREAGGTVSGIGSSTGSILTAGSLVSASHAALHEEICDALKA